VKRVECASPHAVLIYREHHRKSDIRAGSCNDKDTHALKAFETQVDSGRLMARW
jgi:hypothetical protein